MQETDYTEQNKKALKLPPPEEEYQPDNRNRVNGINNILGGIDIFKITLNK